MFSVTCIAPVNIAIVKYWGKRHEELILPINDSISMTLGTNELCAKTTIAASEGFQHNRMWLNDDELPVEEDSRLMRCLKGVQRLALANGSQKVSLSWKVHIASRNNFPTAAGLASSAAGYACLVYSLARLYGVPINEELTTIARQGSGSACRSLYGGFVQWHSGALDDGSDSVAKPVVSAQHWPNMHVLILVVNDERKKTSSTKGMQRSMTTSQLIQHRVDKIVPERTANLKKAIEARDFPSFAEITMKDSNQFHAIALDTYPPCVYMNDVSHAIVDFVHSYNETIGEVQAAYTFDAGPNACIYVLKENVAKLLAAVQKVFPNDATESVEYLRGISVSATVEKHPAFNGTLNVQAKNLLKYIIHTKVGDGPCQLSDDNSLLINGLPLSH
ncbi:diphosphomevalonate decarboxylase [Drosophila guanche]|uniref:Diphosphomevalonate decarboxylase n=1 Tax=Drosophila guanche TaxID=7266 RepID=A0A3B0KKZ9_DROGU|nr:diphosphomevalonate decarboxylase [Drosophila guanche]SPP86476.1 blast:Diphosphomevalonate decarboxylase [Drosophila guanche]